MRGWHLPTLEGCVMYERRFGLEKNPFRMTPDPSFLFLTPIHFSLVVNPTLSPAEFLEAVLLDFGIVDIPSSKVQRLLKLQQFITEAHLNGRTAVLVVDEAHNLSAEVLEEIRLLTNFETAERKLLQIVLVGQGELKALLGRAELRQLRQRIAARFELKPLPYPEVAQYIQFRWTAAGGASPHPFTPAAVDKIARASAGIPRLINAICDNALLLAFATEQETVAAEQIDQVLMDLELNESDLVSEATASNGGARQPEISGTSARQQASVASEMRLKIPMPVATDASLHPMQIRTLERYIPVRSSRPSLWMRWAERLGF
jgi:general secretion pathway protein A